MGQLIRVLMCLILLMPVSPVFSGTGDKKPVPSIKAKREEGLINFLSEYIDINYHKPLFESFLFVSYKRQKMYHIVNGKIIHTYSISTSRFGLGTKPGSGRTPTGLHSIVDKFGYGVPLGGIIIGRSYTGQVSKIYEDNTDASDHVLTRIMWLKSEDRGVNKGASDSYNRSIYIHGTPEEGKIGQPASMGCIRMYNDEAVELFDYAFIGMKVLILKE